MVSQSKHAADYIRQVYPAELNIREAMVVLYLNIFNYSALLKTDLSLILFGI